MSVRLGSLCELAIPSGRMIGPSGRNIIMPPQWVMIVSMYFEITTTVTVGNRVPVLDFYDSASFLNRIIRATAGATIAGNSGALINVMPGLPNNSSPLLGGIYYISFPPGFCVPPNAGFVLFDNAQIDSNDTAFGNIIYST